jgi:hypothetical protein
MIKHQDKHMNAQLQAFFNTNKQAAAIYRVCKKRFARYVVDQGMEVSDACYEIRTYLCSLKMRHLENRDIVYFINSLISHFMPVPACIAATGEREAQLAVLKQAAEQTPELKAAMNLGKLEIM